MRCPLGPKLWRRTERQVASAICSWRMVSWTGTDSSAVPVETSLQTHAHTLVSSLENGDRGITSRLPRSHSVPRGSDVLCGTPTGLEFVVPRRVGFSYRNDGGFQLHHVCARARKDLFRSPPQAGCKCVACGAGTRRLFWHRGLVVHENRLTLSLSRLGNVLTLEDGRG